MKDFPCHQIKIRQLLLINFVAFFSISLPAQKFVDEKSDTCTWDNITPVKYLNAITCAADFSMLNSVDIKQGHTLGSLKVTYDFITRKMYFIKNSDYETHYDFCKAELSYSGDHSDYNETQYKVSKNRKYFNFILSYFQDLDVYTFEFFRNDEISYPNILEVYANLKPYVYFYNKLKFLPTTYNFSAEMLDKSVPVIGFKELYPNTFEALNPGVAYGFLRSTKIQYLDMVNSNDIIILLDEISNDLPLCAGVITTEYQPTLSHINVLSRNRGTPNMVLANPWGDTTILKLIDSLVYFEVDQDGYKITPAKLTDAEKFWRSSRREPQNLPFSLDSTGLVDLATIDCNSIYLVGSKAANFAELSKVGFDKKDSVRVPENAFAIPFYYYARFLRENKIDQDIHALLMNKTIGGYKDSLEKALLSIQKKIMNGKMDAVLLSLVKNKMSSYGDTIIPYRFRSSSNSEDLEFFNGAGLYESRTGMIGSTKKSVEKAIKTVWASLWNYRAFAERRYFNINQETVYMGILVHRAFPDEKANGVAVTADIFDKDKNGFYINVQPNEISIVKPEDASQCDEILVTVTDKKDKIKYLTYNSSYAEKGTVLSDAQIKLLCDALENIKDHYYKKMNIKDPYNQFALDVEFKFDNTGKILYVKQVRRYPFLKQG